jgi:hypothetical protein
MIRIACLAVAAAALASPAAAEKLALPPAPGFIAGHHATQGRLTIDEYVPRGESVQRWTRMITVQRISGLGNVPAPQFVAEIAKRYVAGCRGKATGLAVPFGAAAGARLDCPRNPMTGAPETLFIRAIPGGGDMFCVQIAFRGIPMPRETQWARDYLGRVRLVR